MKTVLLGAFAVLIALPAVANSEWAYVGQSQQGNRMYVHKPSVKKTVRDRSTHVWYSARMVLSQTSPEGWKILDYEYAGNCSAKMQRQRTVIAYDEAGAEIERVEDGHKAPFLRVQPNTPSGAALSFACK